MPKAKDITEIFEVLSSTSSLAAKIVESLDPKDPDTSNIISLAAAAGINLSTDQVNQNITDIVYKLSARVVELEAMLADVNNTNAILVSQLPELDLEFVAEYKRNFLSALQKEKMAVDQLSVLYTEVRLRSLHPQLRTAVCYSLIAYAETYTGIDYPEVWSRIVATNGAI